MALGRYDEEHECRYKPVEILRWQNKERSCDDRMLEVSPDDLQIIRKAYRVSMSHEG